MDVVLAWVWIALRRCNHILSHGRQLYRIAVECQGGAGEERGEAEKRNLEYFHVPSP